QCAVAVRLSRRPRTDRKVSPPAVPAAAADLLRYSGLLRSSHRLRLLDQPVRQSAGKRAAIVIPWEIACKDFRGKVPRNVARFSRAHKSYPDSPHRPEKIGAMESPVPARSSLSRSARSKNRVHGLSRQLRDPTDLRHAPPRLTHLAYRHPHFWRSL